MASRKEYEMLFALNAQMNGNFTGTFSTAQAEFSRLSKEIQALHQLQGDRDPVLCLRKQVPHPDVRREKYQR